MGLGEFIRVTLNVCKVKWFDELISYKDFL